MTRCVCTIASLNYAAQVRALAESVREHEPDASLHWLIVDRKRVDGPPAMPGWVETHWVQDLGVPDFERLAVVYDVLELNTCVKPAFIAQLLERFERVVYLDADILLFGPLAPVWEALDANSIVVTPHALTPYAAGDAPLNDSLLLSVGAFNLGFAAFRRSDEALRLLAWWRDKCLQSGWSEPRAGFFVDQKWADLFACLSDDVGILRHPGCNVAYWNLHERELADVATPRPRVRFGGIDHPLVFFHFSGFDPRRPDRLSKHKKRMQVPDESIRGLLSDYAGTLREHGYAQQASVPYGFGALAGGVGLGKAARRAAAQTRLPAYFANEEFARWLAGYRLGATSPEGGRNPDGRRSGLVRKNLVRRMLRLYARLFGAEKYEALIAYLSRLAAPDEQKKIFPWKAR